MNQITKTSRAGLQTGEKLNTVQTTLYELIATINEDVLSEEDWIVTDAVFEWFETARARFLAPIGNGAI